MSQLELFSKAPKVVRGWEVGEAVSIGVICPDREDGLAMYCYMERAVILGQALDGRYRAEIRMHEGWPKNGWIVLLKGDQMTEWPKWMAI